VPAKAGNAEKSASEPLPVELVHIRVGPPFTSKVTARCPLCHAGTVGTECAVVENTRTEKKTAVHEACLAKRPDLLARRESPNFDTFLSGGE
jgi:hypothetical protein